MKKCVALLMSDVISKRINFFIFSVKKVKKLITPQVMIESRE